MTRRKAVIFDVGGVLARDIWEHMFADLAVRYRLNAKELDKAGRLLWETFAYVPETPANTRRDMERRYWELFLTMFGRRLRSAGLSVKSLIALTDRYVVPIEGMRPILEQLRARRTRLVICSNNNEFWWSRQAKKLRLSRYFPDSRLVLSSRIGAPKDSPRLEMFRQALKAAGVPRSACLFVDDRDANIKRARRYRIDAVLFKDSDAFAAELRKRDLLETVA